MTVIAKVWIEPDCITCNACEDICPEVFSVGDDTSMIVAESRQDGKLDMNEGKTPLIVAIGTELGELIVEAAEACPVEVIKFEEAGGTAPAAEEVAPAAEVAVEAAPAAVEVSAGVSDAMADLLSQDRSLTILFGSQTGNAAGLAEKTGKLAEKYGLTAKVADMDGFDAGAMASSKRLLIITSTWGEGEHPDNAESLWNTVNSGNPSMGGVSYSVCAIGDTSYDEFCKAGKDWDEKLEALSASRVHDIVLCDVDFDTPWQVWVTDALSKIACVDESGTLLTDLIPEMVEYASDTADEVDDGDFTPGSISKEDIAFTLSIFRYSPETSSQGWDYIACASPQHASVQDLLISIRNDVDSSLAFRQGTSAGSMNTGIRANGQVILADSVSIGSLIEDGGELKLEPLPGHPVVRDLVVDHSKYEEFRSNAKPWLRADPRDGEYLLSGAPVGTMEPAIAASLHSRGSTSSDLLSQGMSDCLEYDNDYFGPGIVHRLWLRAEDPRVGASQRRELLKTIQGEGGVWNETDLSAINRQGMDGKLVANEMRSARSTLLTEFKFAGKSGSHIKWFSRTVKWSGTLNETVLAAATLGPVRMMLNAPATIRMALGFTRTGGPLARDLQGWLAPGKMPLIVNKNVDKQYEVKAIYDAMDRRF